MHADNRLTIRFDEWTDNAIRSISEKTGESRSTTIKAMCNCFLTIMLKDTKNKSFCVKNSVKYQRSIRVRLDDNAKKLLDSHTSKLNVSISDYIRSLIYNDIYSLNDLPDRYTNKRKEFQNKHKTSHLRLSDFIRDNYKLIRNAVIQDMKYNEDVFNDTVVLFVSDDEADKLRCKGDLVRHFKYRYNMMLYRFTMNERERKEKENADYIQAKEESADY